MNSLNVETASGMSLFQKKKIYRGKYSANTTMRRKDVKYLPAYLLQCMDYDVVHFLHFVPTLTSTCVCTPCYSREAWVLVSRTGQRRLRESFLFHNSLFSNSP